MRFNAKSWGRTGIDVGLIAPDELCPGSGKDLVDGRCPECRQQVYAGRGAGGAHLTEGPARRHKAPAWLRERNA